MSETIDLNGSPAVIGRQSLQNSPNRIMKSLIEFLVVFTFLIPIILLTFFIAILIKIDSKGPVFFFQERVGKNLKPFRLVKFRTMKLNSDEILNDTLKDPKVLHEWETFHKLTNDPRLTRLGKWLRRFSLDELPQIFNILRGEMSIIGPRPLVHDEILILGDYANTIFRVKPGITGWWQVNGRNNLTFEERTSLDLYYVFNWSLWLDIFILAKTFWVLLIKNK